MGILNFTKKSRKQPQQPYVATIQDVKEDYNSFTLPKSFVTSIDTPEESSLMDDIMNELGSVKSIKDVNTSIRNTAVSNANVTRPKNNVKKDLHVKRSSTPLLSFDTPLKASSSPLVNSATTKPASPPFELQPSSLPAVRNINMQQPQSQLSQHPKQQQKPKPLINFQNKSAMQYDSMATNDNNTRDSYFNDATDNEPIITVARPSPINIDNHITQQQSAQNTVMLEGRKSITLPPSPPTINTLSEIKTSPIPTSTITVNTNTNNTAVPATNGSRTLMERMKERHRQEVRRSLNGSPFLENQTVARKNLSSPSMPTLYSAAALNDPSSLIQNHNAAATGTGSIIPSSPVQRNAARPLVQSHSLSYIKPIANIKRQPNHLVRSTSAMIDMHSTGLLGSRPIQTQSDISLYARHSPPSSSIKFSPPITRGSFIQTGTNYGPSTLPYQIQDEDEMSHPMQYTLNRSVSAYPSFPQQTQQQQQQFQHQQQLKMQQQQIQQQKQQEKIQQQIQQQIEQQQLQQQLEQQHLQHQIDQKQMLLLEQQRMQQQQLQQLKIQKQQQQLLNQSILETPPLKIIKSTKPAENQLFMKKSRPLYERGCSPPNHHQGELISGNQVVVPDTPPPESPQHSLPAQEKSVEEILMSNSSATTLADPSSPIKETFTVPQGKVIKLPNKLKRELENMQLSRSPYSLPNLSNFSDQEEEEELVVDWSTIKVFSNNSGEHELQEIDDLIKHANTLIPTFVTTVTPMSCHHGDGCTHHKLTSSMSNYNCSGRHRCSSRHKCSGSSSSNRKHHHHHHHHGQSRDYLPSSPSSCSMLKNSFSNYSLDKASIASSHYCSHEKRHSHKHKQHRHRCQKRDSHHSRYNLVLENEGENGVPIAF